MRTHTCPIHGEEKCKNVGLLAKILFTILCGESHACTDKSRPRASTLISMIPFVGLLYMVKHSKMLERRGYKRWITELEVRT